MIVLNVLKKDIRDDTLISMNEKEFWKLYLSIKTDNLTDKEIDILSDYRAGTVPEKPSANYKTYSKKIKGKGYLLERQKVEGVIKLQININVT